MIYLCNKSGCDNDATVSVKAGCGCVVRICQDCHANELNDIQHSDCYKCDRELTTEQFRMAKTLSEPEDELFVCQDVITDYDILADNITMGINQYGYDYDPYSGDF